MIFYLFFTTIFLFSSLLNAGYQAAASDSSNTLTNQMFLSSQLTTTNQKPLTNLIDSVATYPLLGVTSKGSLQQGIKSNAITAMTPAKTRPLLRNAGMTILKTTPTAFKNYPTGQTLFPHYPAIATKFDTMISTFQRNPPYVTLFRKVHINVLNELYEYLMGIFMNVSLQHTGITQNENTGDLQVSVPLYLQAEEQYAANTKTLIVNQLINIIESQFNSAIRSYTNNLPQTFATFIGKTAIQNDYSMDLTQLIIHQIEPDLVSFKKTYLQALADYLSFFQLYTSYLNQPHPTYPQAFTAFVDIAEQINQFLYQDQQNNPDKSKIAFAKMNPPLFSFNYDDITALQMIPYLAKTLSPDVKSLAWPDHIVEAAQKGLVLNIQGQTPHPIAYFKTATGSVVRNLSKDTSINLFVCLRLGDNLFEQQLIPQPDWLNSWDGIVKILQACFGDFSAILGMNILDPVMEALISNTLQTQQGKDPNAANNISKAAQETIARWNTLIHKTQTTSSNSNLPPLNQLPNLPSLPPLSITPPLLNQPGA